jgi:hypothetical protein
MSHHSSTRLLVVTALAVTLAACSSQSPTAPGALSSAGAGSADVKPPAGIPGVYTLSFLANLGNGQEEVSSLPVLNTELVLRAQVTDTSGTPAAGGSVTFEYCSYGGRTNDITNADEAPKEACEQGVAKWARLQSVAVAPGTCGFIGGTACTIFGVVRNPRTIGFRFRYSPQKGTISAGTSEARNFVWVAQQ